MGIYSKIEGAREKGIVGETGTVFLGRVKDTSEYLHMLYAPISRSDRKKFEKYISSSKKFDKKVLGRFIDFLAEHNGAVLYGGGIVLFGVTDNNTVNQFLYPSSIVKQNETDYVSSNLNKVLYIGNALHKSKDNINFYYNLENGIVSGYLQGEIVIGWKSIEDFFNYVFVTYDKWYGNDCVHKFFGTKEKFVYRNIQLFDDEV